MWSTSIKAVDAWLTGAGPGKRLIYAHGSFIADLALAGHMNLLAAAGEVCLTRTRASDGAFDYLAIRNRVTLRREKPRARFFAEVLNDPEAGAIYLRLKAAARRGERCPTDAELALLTGLNVNQVAWRLRKLATAGLIRTELRPVPGEPKYRMVTIGASGPRTASPEEWHAVRMGRAR